MSYTNLYVVSISRGDATFRPLRAFGGLEDARACCDQECKDPLITGGYVTDCETGEKVYVVGDQSPEDTDEGPCAGLKE